MSVHASHGTEAPQDQTGEEGAPSAVLRLFAAARLAAGTGRVEVRGRATVGDVLLWARAEFGEGFAAVLDTSRVWCNAEPCGLDTTLADGDEVAVLPPVSGGCGASLSRSVMLPLRQVGPAVPYGDAK